MGLQRVSRSYRADDSGLRELGASASLGTEAVRAAQGMAAKAAATGRGEYSAAPATVTAGWNNERRAGAVVREERRDWRDTRDTVLRAVLEGMRRRGA